MRPPQKMERAPLFIRKLEKEDFLFSQFIILMIFILYLHILSSLYYTHPFLLSTMESTSRNWRKRKSCGESVKTIRKFAYPQSDHNSIELLNLPVVTAFILSLPIRSVTITLFVWDLDVRSRSVFR